MRKAVEDTEWPVCKQFMAAPLKAGSVIIYRYPSTPAISTLHHNMISRDVTDRLLVLPLQTMDFPLKIMDFPLKMMALDQPQSVSQREPQVGPS